MVGREQTGSLSCSQRNKRAIESGRAACQGLLLWLPSEQPQKGAERSLPASDVSPATGDMQLGELSVNASTPVIFPMFIFSPVSQ